jgi:hypothetical protein
MQQLIWDLPVRLYHWALTVSILSAYALPMVARRGSVLFGLHVVCGVVAGLPLAWRLVWVILGTSYFVGGFNAASGVFSPPGTSVSVQLVEPARQRGPRPVQQGAPAEPQPDPLRRAM